MQINNMNRQELMRVGKILLAKKEHIKALSRYASYRNRYHANFQDVSFKEEINDKLEALKDDVIRAELQGRDSVADLKRILKIEISDIKSYKSRKCHPALTKAQDDKARQQSAYFKRACDAHEGQDKLENDHYLYKMYSRLVSLYKKRVKDLQSALKNGNYPKIKQILNEKPIR